jgi:hypothetical protein
VVWGSSVVWGTTQGFSVVWGSGANGTIDPASVVWGAGGGAGGGANVDAMAALTQGEN